MRKNRLILFLLLSAQVFFVPPGFASEDLDTSQQLFFNRFRYAVQAHDTTQLLRLTHSGSKQCVAEEDREIYYGKVLDGLVRVLGKRQTVERVRVSKFTPAGENATADLSVNRNMNWPVMPEVQITMQYIQQGREAVASLYLAKDKDEWKWIHVCAE